MLEHSLHGFLVSKNLINPTMDDDATIAIPEDLVFTILLWLPVESLLRFKTVCKSWLAIIESSAFISEQLLFSSEDNHYLLILDGSQTIRNHHCSSLTLTLLSDHLSRDFCFKPHSLHKPFRLPQIVASFNGLVFLRDEHCTNNDHYLWNPATKQVKTLPFPQFNIKDRPDHSEGLASINYGFGFDVKTDDYKIVRIASESYRIDRTPIKNQIEVYSLNRDSWTENTHVIPLNFIASSDPKSPFRNNGIYCWLGWHYFLNDPIYRKSILSFDFSNEVFGVIPVPDVYVVDFQTILILALLRDRLACIDWVVDYTIATTGHLSCCKIWVLEGYGVKESWTKLYTVVLDSLLTGVRCYINGKIIWGRLNETGLCSCDPVTKEIHVLPFPGEISPLILAGYKESLVYIASRNGKANK